MEIKHSPLGEMRSYLKFIERVQIAAGLAAGLVPYLAKLVVNGCRFIRRHARRPFHALNSQELVR
jgi:hypothetical protein